MMCWQRDFLTQTKVPIPQVVVVRILEEERRRMRQRPRGMDTSRFERSIEIRDNMRAFS